MPPPPKPVEAMDVGEFVTPRLFTSNVTVERWAALLQARPVGMFMFRDELAGHFLNMCRYSNGQDNEFWLEAFNGKSYVVERQSAPAIDISASADRNLRRAPAGQTGALVRGRRRRHVWPHLFAWPSVAAYRPLSDEVERVEPSWSTHSLGWPTCPAPTQTGNWCLGRSLSDEARRNLSNSGNSCIRDWTSSTVANANGGQKGRRMCCGSPARWLISAGHGDGGSEPGRDRGAICPQRREAVARLFLAACSRGVEADGAVRQACRRPAGAALAQGKRRQ